MFSNQFVKTVGTSFLCLFLIAAKYSYAQETDQLALKSQHAKELMAEGNFAQAISIYRELNRAIPNNPGLLLNLGIALHMAAKGHEAIPELERAVKLDPRLQPAWLFLGATRLQLGEPSAAIKPLRAAIRLQPDQLAARLMLADALFALARFQEAAFEYRRLADSNPEDAKACYGLGRSYESLSGRTFGELQKAAPQSAYVVALLAETQLREQQFSSALFLYRRALDQMPTLRGLHRAMAEIYRRTGHPSWAEIEDKRESQLSAPVCSDQSSECQFMAGHYEYLTRGTSAKTADSLYWQSRAYNELALAAFGRLGQLPPSPELHELKARIYSSQKKYSEAATEWREAAKMSPNDTGIQKELAISLKFSQDYGAALPLLEALVRQQPTSPELNYLLGDTLLDQQRVEEAIPLLKRAVIQNPKSISAHKSLARAELAAGRASEAIPHLRIALPTDTDGSLHYQLAQAYQAGGQSELAQRTIAQYQDIQRSAAAARQGTQEDMEITPP